MPLTAEVVSADGIVWVGPATQVTARTIEGDVGILPRHEPFLAALVPCAAEIISEDGRREIIAIDGGFISVADDHVSLLSQYARLAHEILLPEAEKELAAAQKLIDDGDLTEETRRHYRRASAQVKAAEKAAGQS
ncbi:MAG: F0F1 ATP synthase subunit epsilon [Propionibacteriaceae bacterium]|nr:F0F1 ATP synthase subunit epsilon [Micropruina sp.]HBX81554.1 F0F1 ATP synthase subunit epsilon [Propionibacteriaceae bacterium]HBY24499.1 F0F1 ATP synthase subunit epsilon [Propionibacteriaceae bacterium]